MASAILNFGFSNRDCGNAFDQPMANYNKAPISASTKCGYLQNMVICLFIKKKQAIRFH